MQFSPDVANNPSNLHVQRHQIIDFHKLSVIMRNDAGKTY